MSLSRHQILSFVIWKPFVIEGERRPLAPLVGPTAWLVAKCLLKGMKKNMSLPAQRKDVDPRMCWSLLQLRLLFFFLLRAYYYSVPSPPSQQRKKLYFMKNRFLLVVGEIFTFWKINVRNLVSAHEEAKCSCITIVILLYNWAAVG